MNATRTLASTLDYQLPAEFFGGFEDDFDVDAINDALCDAINAGLPEGVYLAHSGQVFYDDGMDADDVYQAVADAQESVDADAINALVAQHVRTGR